MSTIKIQSTSIGKCEVIHEPSGETIKTDLPAEYGGAASSFSATDLLASALGVCIATNIDKVAERHGIPLNELEIQVKKELSNKPKQIFMLQVSINLNLKVPEDIKRRIKRAAHACLVHRSLHPDLNVTVELTTAHNI